MSETIPDDWAIAKALDLGWRPQGYCNFDDAKSKIRCGTWPALQAFAAYIAAHEEPPVDPLLIEARKLVAARYTPRQTEAIEATMVGEDDNHQSIQNALAALRRGIELGQAKP